MTQTGGDVHVPESHFATALRDAKVTTQADRERDTYTAGMGMGAAAPPASVPRLSADPARPL